MKYILIIIFLSTLSCAKDKVRNNHGALSLEKKEHTDLIYSILRKKVQ